MKHYSFTNIRNFLFLISFTLLNIRGHAQENSQLEDEGLLSGFRLSGSVDTYFKTNINGLNKYIYDEGGNIVEFPQAAATSFASDPGFAIGMANLILGYDGEKVGFVADLVFGPRGEEAVFLSGPSTNIVNQLYAYYNLSDKVTLTLGNFNTFLGYEVISPAVNFNYSTSYMFSYGPFSHTGLKADFKITERWTGMLAVMNPTDFTEFNPFNLYSFGGQIGYSYDSGSAFLNLLYGEQTPEAEATFQIDLTTGWDISSALYLGLNSTYNTTDGEGFYGVALYPQVKTSENFAIGLRAEYFKELEGGGFVYGADAETTALTLTGNYTVGNLIIKPEFRLDQVSEDVFLDRKLQPIPSLSSFILAAVYAF